MRKRVCVHVCVCAQTGVYGLLFVRVCVCAQHVLHV